MKIKHLALCCLAFTLSGTALAAPDPDPSTFCTTTNSCKALTPMPGGIVVAGKTGPITADAWQIQCTNDDPQPGVPTAILYGLMWDDGSGYHYYILSQGGKADTMGKSYTSADGASGALQAYCTQPLLKGPNPDGSGSEVNVPRKPLSDWYPPKNS